MIKVWFQSLCKFTLNAVFIYLPRAQDQILFFCCCCSVRVRQLNKFCDAQLDEAKGLWFCACSEPLLHTQNRIFVHVQNRIGNKRKETVIRSSNSSLRTSSEVELTFKYTKWKKIKIEIVLSHTHTNRHRVQRANSKKKKYMLSLVVVVVVVVTNPTITTGTEGKRDGGLSGSICTRRVSVCQSKASSLARSPAFYFYNIYFKTLHLFFFSCLCRCCCCCYHKSVRCLD